MESISRIYVRNLPLNLTAEDFKKHFTKLAPSTDAKLIQHRRIGYVGFRTPEDATRAVKYYNKSFIRTSRINVELAKPFEKTRPHKSLADTSGNVVKEITFTSNEKDFRNPGSAISAVAESAVATSSDGLNLRLPRDNVDVQESEQQIEVKRRAAEDEVDEEDQEQPSKRRKVYSGSEDSRTKALQPSRGSNDDPNSIEVNPTHNDADTASKQVATTDDEWLRSRTSRTLGLLQDDELDERDKHTATDHGKEGSTIDVRGDDSLINKNQTLATEVNGESHQEDLHENLLEDDVGTGSEPETDRLFLRNLPYTACEEDLRLHFERQGLAGVIEIHLPSDSRSGQNKGYAHVQFTESDAAAKALQKLDQRPFQGRLLHVIPSKPRKQTVLDEFAISKLPLKRQKQIKRKAEASSFTFNWNSMYMNSDAVMSSLASQLGVSKSELLDPSSSDAAVKQAHAETHVIQEAKGFFMANGVDIDAFKGQQRGARCLLVKNFPFGTQAEDLKKLFEAYGPLSKLLMPPSGTIAIVEFEKDEDAKSALHSLAYRKFNGSILFLEKGPKDIFTGDLRSTKTAEGEEHHQAKSSATELFESEQAASANTSTLFVRNLSFSTNEERLRQAFGSLDGFVSGRVKTKPDPKSKGQVLSMGFGFLDFQTKEQAQAAMVAMQGYRLDGYELLIRPSQKTADAAEERRLTDEAKKKAGQRTKIIIKNLPFESTKKDVRSLFGAYGQLRSVRTPRKFDGSTRGFAFADFITAREAENAMTALRDTHFLGRRLVLEFAAAETIDPELEIAKMQQKVGKQVDKVALQQLTGTGRRKFNVEGADDGFAA